MEEEMARLPLNSNGEETPNYTDQEIPGLDGEDYVGQEYHHNSTSIDEKGSIEIQEWSTESSEKCNLIVNYLPHEIDDIVLKVRASTSFKTGFIGE